MRASVCDDEPFRLPQTHKLSNRIIDKVRTIYRSEWTYALHITLVAGLSVSAESIADLSATVWPSAIADSCPAELEAQAALAEAIALLSPKDQFIIDQLFFEPHTEHEVAKKLGISQPAVCKRKQKVVSALTAAIRPNQRRHSVFPSDRQPSTPLPRQSGASADQPSTSVQPYGYSTDDC